MAKKDINVVVCTGRLGKAIEKRTVGTGDKAFTSINFSIAANRTARQVNGEWKQEVDWLPVSMAGRSADYVAEHAEPGDEIVIESGSLESYSYTNKEGNKISGLRIHAASASVNKKAAKGDSNNNQGQRKASASANRPEPEPVDLDFADDDLPF